MKVFEKRSVAAAVMVLAIVAGIVIGQARKPADTGEASTAVVGSYQYIRDTEGVISEKTAQYVDAMNASLFAQTGAQIAVEVVDTTGAGDTFCGYFIASIAGGKRPEDALQIASLASSLTISRKGAAPSIPAMTQVAAFGREQGIPEELFS